MSTPYERLIAASALVESLLGELGAKSVALLPPFHDDDNLHLGLLMPEQTWSETQVAAFDERLAATTATLSGELEAKVVLELLSEPEPNSIFLWSLDGPVILPRKPQPFGLAMSRILGRLRRAGVAAAWLLHRDESSVDYDLAVMPSTSGLGQAEAVEFIDVLPRLRETVEELTGGSARVEWREAGNDLDAEWLFGASLEDQADDRYGMTKRWVIAAPTRAAAEKFATEHQMQRHHWLYVRNEATGSTVPFELIRPEEVDGTNSNLGNLHAQRISAPTKLVIAARTWAQALIAAVEAGLRAKQWRYAKSDTDEPLLFAPAAWERIGFENADDNELVIHAAPHRAEATTFVSSDYGTRWSVASRITGEGHPTGQLPGDVLAATRAEVADLLRRHDVAAAFDVGPISRGKDDWLDGVQLVIVFRTDREEASGLRWYERLTDIQDELEVLLQYDVTVDPLYTNRVLDYVGSPKRGLLIFDDRIPTEIGQDLTPRKVYAVLNDENGEVIEDVVPVFADTVEQLLEALYPGLARDGVGDEERPIAMTALVDRAIHDIQARAVRRWLRRRDTMALPDHLRDDVVRTLTRDVGEPPEFEGSWPEDDKGRGCPVLVVQGDLREEMRERGLNIENVFPVWGNDAGELLRSLQRGKVISDWGLL